MSRIMIWTMLAALGAAACAPAPDRDPSLGEASAAASDSTSGAGEPYVRPAAEGGDLVQGDTVPGLPAWTRQDWAVLEKTVAWARANRVDTLPIGERIVSIGETFVGSPYLPQTLDPPGPERMVINLRAMDCVTFVENMLALAHFVVETPADVLDRPEGAMRLYQAMLERIRYRDGRLAGYPSRLHYFTDWLRDNERRGLLQLVKDDLGGVVDAEPITFMTGHRTAYRQLAEDADYAEIGRIERGLNQVPRPYIPEERVAALSDRIRNGDVLAMTSNLAGLDVAHTGIAVWRGGTLHLMNAPLVGKSVEISEKTLSDRLLGIKGQDGIMVGRPLGTPLPIAK